MAVCIKCGSEGDSCLCGKCRNEVNIEELCGEIIAYQPGSGENELWDRLSSGMIHPYDFKNIAFSLSAELPSPRKEYMRILCMASGGSSVPKAGRPWLYETYKTIMGSEGLNAEETNRVKGLVLGALYMDYRYAEADALAGELLGKDDLPKQTVYNLADFLLKTRRYDEAADVIESAKKRYADDAAAINKLNSLSENNEKYRDAEANGGKEYMPNPRENKDEAQKAYTDFLISIGIDAETPTPAGSVYRSADGHRSGCPIPILKDRYPSVREVREANFDSFVAFDVETTGLNPVFDSIIEIGAVKVVNGRLDTSAEFTFQEFVKPFKRSIRQEITDVTGITKEDISHAREMWEVFPDFMKFVGDNVLVGFNNVCFDSKFLERAGRYSHLIIENPQFDVMRYAQQFRERSGSGKDKVSLAELGSRLGVKNPEAHRALADAVTTAEIYLKLKEMDTGSAGVSADDLLADLDEW